MKYPKPLPPVIPPGVIYARFSPRPYHRKIPKTIQTQTSICEDYCRTREMEIIGRFYDEYASGGWRAGRPGFEDAMKMAKENKAVLVVYDLSRFARSTRDATHCLAELDEAGAHLASVLDTLDTSSPMGRCIFTVMAAFNQLEREHISLKTRDALLTMQRKGFRVGRYAPYGWAIDPEDPKRTVRVPSEQRAITIILQLRDSGMQWKEVIQELHRLEIAPRGKWWRVNRLKIYNRAQVGI